MIYVNCIDGFSASSRSQTFGLDFYMSRMMGSANTGCRWWINTEESSSLFGIRRSGKFIKGIDNKERHGLILAGKSKGAVDTLTVVDRYFPLVDEFKSVLVLLFDPHGKARGEFFKPPYGKRSANVIDRWGTDYPVINVYQKNKWPTGAYVYGASNFRCQRGTDHFNILKNGIGHNFIRSTIEMIGIEVRNGI